MNLFDLHCDTLDVIERQGNNLKDSHGTVTLKGMKRYEKCIRCFAIWVDDVLIEYQANKHFYKLYDIYKTQLSLYENDVVQITDKNSFQDSRIGMMLTVENGSVLNGSLLEIEKMACLGVKMFSLTWNGENSLGYGQLENKGLKPFGKECVSVLEENGIIVDVSHLSEKGFDDVCALSKKPFVASHSNAKSIVKHNRNLTNDQICEIIKRKGLIGINLYRDFLNENPDESCGADILRHAEHILSLGGEDVLAVGTDFDGGHIVKGFENDFELIELENLFFKSGFSQVITDKILYKNANRFFITNL